MFEFFVNYSAQFSFTKLASSTKLLLPIPLFVSSQTTLRLPVRTQAMVEIVFWLKPVKVSIIRPINGTAMNRKASDLFFIAVGFNQRIQMK